MSPRTEAGKRLLRVIGGTEGMVDRWADAILAIEAEAAVPSEAVTPELRARVEDVLAEWRPSEMTADYVRKVVREAYSRAVPSEAVTPPRSFQDLVSERTAEAYEQGLRDGREAVTPLDPERAGFLWRRVMDAFGWSLAVPNGASWEAVEQEYAHEVAALASLPTDRPTLAACPACGVVGIKPPRYVKARTSANIRAEEDSNAG